MKLELTKFEESSAREICAMRQIDADETLSVKKWELVAYENNTLHLEKEEFEFLKQLIPQAAVTGESQDIAVSLKAKLKELENADKNKSGI